MLLPLPHFFAPLTGNQPQPGPHGCFCDVAIRAMLQSRGRSNQSRDIDGQEAG
jgi:hypothetical protein